MLSSKAQPICGARELIAFAFLLSSDVNFTHHRSCASIEVPPHIALSPMVDAAGEGAMGQEIRG
jgi:hypothetical protein